MHNALRAHENPALDTAICWARQNGLPLLVYHAISEEYPFASDRIHCFMLQGHRDVQRKLADRGIKAYFHLEREGHRGPHLRDLTRQAAVLVTELMPVQPLAGWIERLASRTKTPIATSDASCVLPIPVPVSEEACAHVDQYRSATKALHSKRVDLPYDEQPVDCEIFSGELPFVSMDLQDVSFADVISQCQVDHSISPVVDSPGGSRAGYARWNCFRDRFLEGGSVDNNDQDHQDDQNGWVESRLSAYLHFGMVSPLRIAREASSLGANRFLDRLLIFRELSFRFCDANIDQIETLDSLPDWALQSLLAHQADAREADYSWETLSRGQSKHPLWNACQRSLLKHGELHDDLRKTWGKALLRWTSTAGRSMRVAMDLNHRYALDGRDPCGYGGVLWCFGQFDQPSQSTQDYLGTVPARPLDDHLNRIDLDRLNKHVDRPVAEDLPRVAVVGAGLAGLMASRTLTDHGLDVTIFEKSGGVGGRMSTRRINKDTAGENAGEKAVLPQYQFDHGAQYFTARDPRFCRYVQSWIHDGIVKPWTGRIVELKSDGHVVAEKRSTLRYVGSPKMNTVARHLATDLNIQNHTRVERLVRSDRDTWNLIDSSENDLGEFDVVIANCPAPQALHLIGQHSSMSDQIRKVKMNSTWAVMLAANGLSDIPYDAAFINDGPLSWIARNSSKPGRKHEACQTWVLHASQQWSRDHINDSADTVQSQLIDAFRQATGCKPFQLDYAVAHRWLYAIPEKPLDQECLWDPAMGIAACGDWCGGPRIEGAFLSGMAAAGALLRHLTVDRSFQNVRVGIDR
ncbi:FAD-dependent oxidoreductase [Rubripirellula obstinata]|nr:FAD-dependent oxidoreductase [Rubripirellula obstinata]